jgi:hypothetical protein
MFDQINQAVADAQSVAVLKPVLSLAQVRSRQESFYGNDQAK